MKLAVITGASSGIGAATAMRLAAENYKVVMVARNHSRLEELAGTIGQQAVVEAGDAGDGRQVLEMAERVRSEHGVPDLIVNSAGAGEWKRIEDTSPEEAVTGNVYKTWKTRKRNHPKLNRRPLIFLTMPLTAKTLNG